MSGLSGILIPVIVIVVTFAVSYCIYNDASVNLSLDEIIIKDKLSELLDECIIYKTQEMEYVDKWIDYLINLKNNIISLKDIHSREELRMLVENFRNQRLVYFNQTIDTHFKFTNSCSEIEKLLTGKFIFTNSYSEIEELFSNNFKIINSYSEIKELLTSNFKILFCDKLDQIKILENLMKQKFIVINNLEADINNLL